MAAWTFALSLGVLLFVVVVFPALQVVWARVRPRPWRDDGAPVDVTVVLAAHDEAAVIEERIRNLLAQDYPSERLHVVVACDGQDDGTWEAARRHASDRVRVLGLARVGKAAAMNAALARVRTPVVAFTDANTRWEPGALRALVAPFADPDVGAVAGDQVYVGADRADPVAAVEGLYWAVDRTVKRAQARCGSVTSATGAIHAMRRELVDPIPAGVTDDFFLSTGAIVRGRRLVFADGARAVETLAPTRQVEFARKVRIITRGLRAVRTRAELLDPRRHGLYALQLLTHKVLRRLLVVPLVLLLVSAVAGSPQSATLRLAAVAQLVWYGVAAAGLLLPRDLRGPLATLCRAPAYVCLAYAAATVAAVRTVRGQEVTRWDHERLRALPTDGPTTSRPGDVP